MSQKLMFTGREGDLKDPPGAKLEIKSSSSQPWLQLVSWWGKGGVLCLFVGGGGLGVPKTFVHSNLAELSNFWLLFLLITLLPLSTTEQILIENSPLWYKVNEYETQQ